VTVDTNVLARDMERIKEACEGFDVEIAPTTVTLRERGMRLPDPSAIPETGVYDESYYDSGAVYETLVLDESRLGMAVLGGDDAPSRFEGILSIIGDGSFPPPGQRDELTEPVRRQLRDAMILEAHARDGRDVLISNDKRAFVGKDGQKRARLEGLCSTRIRTVEEFCSEIASLASRR
jgi:hypothetical protein